MGVDRLSLAERREGSRATGDKSLTEEGTAAGSVRGM